MQGLSDLSERHNVPMDVTGLESWFTVSVPGTTKSGGTANVLFNRRLLEQGIFCLGDWTITLSHGTRELEETLDAADKALQTVREELA